ncbi:hypothetical protein PO909_005299 [Leuciscus waleckii]
MISANASPQEKNLNMGLLSIHPACYPLAVQRQLGMLKPRTSKQNIIWDPRITAEHKSLRSSREDRPSVARRQSVERERDVTHCCFQLPYANALCPISAWFCLCSLCLYFSSVTVQILYGSFCVPVLVR